MWVYMIYIYASNTDPLPSFLKKIASTLPYDSASAFPLPFPCNLVIDTVVRLVISNTVGPDKVAKLVLGSPPVRPTV